MREPLSSHVSDTRLSTWPEGRDWGLEWLADWFPSSPYVVCWLEVSYETVILDVDLLPSRITDSELSSTWRWDSSLCSLAFTVTGSSKFWCSSLWDDTHLSAHPRNAEFSTSSWFISIPVCQPPTWPSVGCDSPQQVLLNFGKSLNSGNDVTYFLRFPWSPQSVASSDCRNDHLFLCVCP